ncbi:hypothetical protein [Portibacter lacus]|uniref:Uncharacterized protein n=1 Tax=Portibacter lacus TaxID=1099794 RepID=A0AA37SMK7_9BACT|nr:hypothetical protein [Portibacter lacus]GLR15729.1 hypothetical protein GCM10007940_03440 [Portibacter lacus]
MDVTLIERKEKLQQEIDRASLLLEENVNNASLKDYISIGTSSIPGALHGIIDDPKRAISSADMIARTILPQKNLIRQIFKYLSVIKQGYKIITNK